MYKKIRLREFDVQQIIESFKEHFGPEDHLWIFGSRVELEKRGGDIDLYVETVEPDPSVALKKKGRFISDLHERIGEQKIDVVLNTLSKSSDLLVYRIARKEGVLLV